MEKQGFSELRTALVQLVDRVSEKAVIHQAKIDKTASDEKRLNELLRHPSFDVLRELGLDPRVIKEEDGLAWIDTGVGYDGQRYASIKSMGIVVGKESGTFDIRAVEYSLTRDSSFWNYRLSSSRNANDLSDPSEIVAIVVTKYGENLTPSEAKGVSQRIVEVSRLTRG